MQDPIEKRRVMNAVSRQADNAVPEAKEDTSDECRNNQKTSHNAVDTVITLHNTQQLTKFRGSEPQQLHLIMTCQTRKICIHLEQGKIAYKHLYYKQ